MSFIRRLLGKGDEREPAAPAAEPLLVNAYATLRDLPPLDFPHEPLGARDLSDPELAGHLHGFIGYAMGRGDGGMTATRYHAWRHLQRVRNHISFQIAAADASRVEAWGRAANAVLFLPDGSVRAPDMTVLLSAEGDSDPLAALPYPSDAIERRVRTRAALAGVKPQPAASMPPALGEAELVLRPPEEVLHRALALFHVAARAQARGAGLDPIAAGRADRNPLGAAALTPQEQAFVADDAAGPEGAAALTWRYEAANALLWALGLEGAAIAESDRLVDVDALWSSAAAWARDGARNNLCFRSANEILEALDRTWLEHWVVRQADRMGAVPEYLNGDVVMERHHALNWLTNFQNEPGVAWDDTDTPT